MKIVRPQTLIVPVVLALLTIPLAPPAAANHQYDQPVWFNWDRTQIDVLVISPNDPLIGSAIQAAFDAWDTGIAQLAPALHSQLDLRYYWPGKDAAPPLDFDADIVVAPQGFMAVWSGLLDDLGQPQCVAFAPMMAGWGTLYSVTSHEFGHCLGLDHVYNHGVEYSPAKDIMGNGVIPGGGKACPSNLNIMVLERVFNGQGGTVSISSGSYFQSSC